MKIVCIRVIGVALSDAATEAIYKNACRMAQKHSHEWKIKHDDVEGIIYSDYNVICFVGMAGYEFKADIETKHGKTKIVFIGPEDLDENVELQIEHFPKKKRPPKYLDKFGVN